MRKLLLLLTLLVAPVAFAQNGLFYAVDPPAPNARLLVCALPTTGPAPNPCTSPASLYQDIGLTIPAANPTTLTPSGTYGFWVAAGQYVVELSGTVSRTYVITLGGAAGSAGTLPRLDQVLNQNQNKLFNQGGATLGFTGGPGLDLSGETSPATLPLISSCTPSTNGQICFDATNLNYAAYNGGVQNFALFPSTVVSGDIAGFLLAGGKWTLQDLGPPSGSTGNFIKVNVTNIQEGDSICWDVATSSWVNCTEGVPVTKISATSYTVNCLTDRGAYLLFSATSAIAVSLPQAGTSTCDANFFTYIRTLSATVTVTPTVSTIDDGGGAGATLLIQPGYGSNVFSADTNYIAKLGPYREDSHALMSVEGFDVNSLGAYQWQSPNNGTTGTTANKMACDDGTGKEIICSHTTSTTDVPDGVAVAALGATPGTTGSVGICIIGYCSVVFDNSATANHYAQVSTSVDGDLTDVGTTAPTNGQPYYKVFTSNAGAGTQAIIRDLTPSELSAAQVGGGGKTTVQFDGTSTQPVANISDSGQCSNWTTANSGNVTTAHYHPCHAISFSVYNSAGLAAGTTEASFDMVSNISFACTIKSWSLAVSPSGTATVKFWRVNGGTAIPTSGNSINTSGVSLASGTAVTSTTLTDFTSTAIASGDRLIMDITAVTSANLLNGVLSCQE